MSLKKVLIVTLAAISVAASADTFNIGKKGDISTDDGYRIRTWSSLLHFGSGWGCTNLFSNSESEEGYPKKEKGLFINKCKLATKPEGIIFDSDIRIEVKGSKATCHFLMKNEEEGIETVDCRYIIDAHEDTTLPREKTCTINGEEQLFPNTVKNPIPDVKEFVFPYGCGKMKITSKKGLKIAMDLCKGHGYSITIRPDKYEGELKKIELDFAMEFVK